MERRKNLGIIMSKAEEEFKGVIRRRLAEFEGDREAQIESIYFLCDYLINKKIDEIEN